MLDQSAAFPLGLSAAKKGWLEWVDWAALISKRMAMISYDSLWLHFHQKRFLGLSVCVHDRVRIESRFQSPIFNALGVQLPKREAKILRAALFQQVWQFQQIAPSSVFRAVLDGRRTCKSPRASTHESSDVMCVAVAVHFTYCPELRRWNGGDSLTVVGAWFFLGRNLRNIEPFMETEGLYCIYLCASTAAHFEWQRNDKYFILLKFWCFPRSAGDWMT